MPPGPRVADDYAASEAVSSPASAADV